MINEINNINNAKTIPNCTKHYFSLRGKIELKKKMSMSPPEDRELTPLRSQTPRRSLTPQREVGVGGIEKAVGPLQATPEGGEASQESKCVVVRNVDFSVQSLHMVEIFSFFSDVVNARRVAPRGIHTEDFTLELTSVDEAINAITHMNNGFINGRSVTVAFVSATTMTTLHGDTNDTALAPKVRPKWARSSAPADWKSKDKETTKDHTKIEKRPREKDSSVSPSRRRRAHSRRKESRSPPRPRSPPLRRRNSRERGVTRDKTPPPRREEDDDSPYRRRDLKYR